MRTEQIFAERLREAMTDRGVGVYKLAEEAGVCFTTVYCWLRGERVPSGSLIPQLCRVLDVSADWLLGLRGYSS